MRKHGNEEKIDLQETTLGKAVGVHMDPELVFTAFGKAGQQS